VQEIRVELDRVAFEHCLSDEALKAVVQPLQSSTRVIEDKLARARYGTWHGQPRQYQPWVAAGAVSGPRYQRRLSGQKPLAMPVSTAAPWIKTTLLSGRCRRYRWTVVPCSSMRGRQRKDLTAGQQAGVTGTPSFFLGVTGANDAKVTALRQRTGAQPSTAFLAAIDSLLADPKEARCLPWSGRAGRSPQRPRHSAACIGVRLE
jgi:hypothetical protein